jgi:glucose-1-phosphate thymidylyltransferase
MKGIILAGGSGTRLHPLTISVTKQLLPIYDKPMIYYPLSTLMSLGIKDILIICTPNDKHLFEQLLGDGKQFGINLSYRIQPSPDGLAQAFIIGEEFIGDDSVALVLGDNIFSGLDIKKIKKSIKNIYGSMIFAYHVHDPERYGVVEFDEEYNVVSLDEKPTLPKSNYAVPGLYFYDNNVIQIAKKIKPSWRGELEITDVNRDYLDRNMLKVHVLERGTAWLDTGTFESLMQASHYVQSIEERQGLKIGCIEEIAYMNKWINKNELIYFAEKYHKNNYGKYLKSLIERMN